MKGYKHIIWDWNGTLLNDAHICVDILNEILLRRGMTAISYEQYREDFDFPVKDYYQKIGFDFTVESFDVVANEYIKEYSRRQFEGKLQDGAFDVLNRCADLGLGQSILSAYQQDLLERVVSFFGIRNLFYKVIGLNDYYASCKIESGRGLIVELGFDSKEVLLVGDTVHDFEVAKEISTDCVLTADGHNPKEKLEKCGVEVLDSIKKVLDYLS